jgi:hypothetical protein
MTSVVVVALPKTEVDTGPVAVIVVVTVEVDVTGVATSEQAENTTVDGYLVRTVGVDTSRFSALAVLEGYIVEIEVIASLLSKVFPATGEGSRRRVTTLPSDVAWRFFAPGILYVVDVEVATTVVAELMVVRGVDVVVTVTVVTGVVYFRILEQ